MKHSKGLYSIFSLLILILLGSTDTFAQDNNGQTAFRPATIIEGIDKPEGMAMLGHELFISHYSENGSIVKYDLATRMVSGKVAEGLNYPSGLLAFEDKLVVLEYGTGSIYRIDPETGQKELIASGLKRPADIIQFKEDLLVSDYGTGIIYQLNPKTFEKTVFASGLATPAGLAVFRDEVHVAEWGMGRISRIKADGKKEILVAGELSSPWGLMVYNNELYVAENGSDQISRIHEVKIPVKGSLSADAIDRMNAARDSITVWKVTSMKCDGLDHPEAFSVSERGIYISEWKSKEVSEIRLNSPPTGELVLAGNTKLGQVIEAEPQRIKDEDGLGPFSYRWQIASHPDSEQWDHIDGKKVAYRIKKENLVGSFIRAELSYTDQKGFAEYVYSDARLITQPFAPQVTLSFSPDNFLQPGDTVTLTAEVTVLDKDAKQDKVEFYSNGQLLVSLESAPFSYRFIVQDDKATVSYIDPLSIVAKGFDTNDQFGTDEKTAYVTNKSDYKEELLSLFRSADKDIGLFPNPATDVLNIVYKKEGAIHIRLLDMSNKVMLSGVIVNGAKTLDISELVPAIYIVEYTIDGETKAERIIKL